MKFFPAGASRIGLLLILVLGFQATAIAQVVDHRPDPRQLFERMRLATIFYSYSGSLTYEHDGQLSSFALSSEISNQQRTQNIRALNGPERNFARQLSPCDFGSLEQLKAEIANEAEKLALYYNFQARGDFRIAGREAQEVLVMPVDQFRYGYHFAVDTETGLMLQSMTMDSARKILERFQFIEIENSSFPEEHEVSAESCTEAQQPAESEMKSVPWRLAWMPAGFERLTSDYQDNRVELVYSDGLAAVSIFIVPLEQVRLPPSTTSTGATSLMLNYYDVSGTIYGVTLVGEVPLATLQRIASELRYEEIDDAG